MNQRVEKIIGSTTRIPVATLTAIKAGGREANWFVRNKVRLLIEYILIGCLITSMGMNAHLAISMAEMELDYEQQLAILTVERDGLRLFAESKGGVINQVASPVYECFDIDAEK